MRIERITSIAHIVIMWATVVGLIAIIVWAFGWLERRDQQLMLWAGSYEDCVAEQYHTTPTAWRIEHGEYPECSVQIEIIIK